MDWHYAVDGRQTGPVSEEQLLQLAQSGVVKPDTLIWHSGMTDWKPFREVGPGGPPPVPLPYDPLKRHCASCGLSFPASELAVFGDSAICAACKPAWVQRVRQGMVPMAPGTFRYAGFWIRVGAQLIDGLITGTVFGAIFFGMYGGTFLEIFRQAAEAGRTGNQVDPSVFMGPMFATMGLFQLLAFAASLAYFVFFWVKYGATPGKMAVGIKVVTPEGGPISAGQAIARYFAHILSGIILYIGYMMAGWDDQKRALHDRLANTRVIRVR